LKHVPTFKIIIQRSLC